MTVFGDPGRERVGYMIASLAVHFVVYHEAGHPPSERSRTHVTYHTSVPIFL